MNPDWVQDCYDRERRLLDNVHPYDFSEAAERERDRVTALVWSPTRQEELDVD